MSQVTYAVADGVARIVLNRPEKLNAMTPAMSAALAGFCTDAGGDSGRPRRAAFRRGPARVLRRQRPERTGRQTPGRGSSATASNTPASSATSANP